MGAKPLGFGAGSDDPVTVWGSLWQRGCKANRFQPWVIWLEELLGGIEMFIEAIQLKV